MYLCPKPQLSCKVVMADLLRKFHTEVSVCSVFWYTLIHDLVYDIKHIVLQMSKRKTERNVKVVIMKLLGVCLMFTLISHKHRSDLPAERNGWDARPGMSGTGWRAVCISEGPSCHPDYPALRPPGSAPHPHSKTGREAEGQTSAPQNRKTENLSWSTEWKNDLHRCLCMYLHEQCPVCALTFLRSEGHPLRQKKTQTKKTKTNVNSKKCRLLYNGRKWYQNRNQKVYWATDRP